MGIEGTCEDCGGATRDYECLRCIRRERDELLLQVEELKKYRAEAPEALKTLAKAIEDRDNKLNEKERRSGEFQKTLEEIVAARTRPEPMWDSPAALLLQVKKMARAVLTAQEKR